MKVFHIGNDVVSLAKFIVDRITKTMDLDVEDIEDVAPVLREAAEVFSAETDPLWKGVVKILNDAASKIEKLLDQDPEVIDVDHKKV